MLLKIAVLCFMVGYIQCKKLPSYITPCKKSDPNLSKCATESAKAALPTIMKGDKNYRYPMLEPFHLDAVNLKPSDTLTISLKDVLITGIKDAEIEDIQIDIEKKHMVTKIYAPSVSLSCQYTVDGKILVLPISGSGPATMRFDGLHVVHAFDFTLIEKNGKTYIDSNINPTVTFTLDKSSFNLENLFNGDKQLGDHMNKFLNENHKEVAKDLGKAVSETMNAIATQIIQGILQLVPYDSIFLE